MSNKIIYTLTDEAPMLATYSLLPIIQRFPPDAILKKTVSVMIIIILVITTFIFAIIITIIIVIIHDLPHRNFHHHHRLRLQVCQACGDHCGAEGHLSRWQNPCRLS